MERAQKHVPQFDQRSKASEGVKDTLGELFLLLEWRRLQRIPQDSDEYMGFVSRVGQYQFDDDSVDKRTVQSANAGRIYRRK